MIKKGITFVIALLRAQVIEVMDELTLKEEAILRIIEYCISNGKHQFAHGKSEA